MTKIATFFMTFILWGCSPQIQKLPPKDVKSYDCILMGDSITEIWNNTRQGFFVNNNFKSVGIGGQTTGQMLDRFKTDVVELEPRCVSILGGINDIARNQGYVSNEQILENIKSMAKAASKAKIKVIICSVLPADQIGWNPSVTPQSYVKQLNEMLKKLAADNSYAYLDYYSAFVDPSTGGFKNKSYTTDGVHVTDECYKIMESMFLETINEVLK